MRTRRLGQTDLYLSVIGIGTWVMGGAAWEYGWGVQEEKDSIGTIHEALDRGINWIDTASIYGLGRSEELVGKAVKQWNKPVIIASKCGLLRDKNGSLYGCLKRESIMREAEASLRRLQRDVIDLYQIHWPDPSAEIEEGFGTLLELVRQGKIRWAGVSNFSIKQMEKIACLGPIASLQPSYNLINRRIEKDVLPWCKKNNVGVISYSPLQCGILTEKFSREWIMNLPDDDWRKTKAPFLQEPQLSFHLELVQVLKKFAATRGHTVSQLAVSWILHQNHVTSVIVGARKRAQIQETALAAEWVLKKEEIQELESLLFSWIKNNKCDRI
ncbi:MAG: aldo/keto reductase [Candidatus Aureabacteria bacterium]|nr:aldo/keto reductase [Candidatus Auribacterota bacterium]